MRKVLLNTLLMASLAGVLLLVDREHAQLFQGECK